MFYFYTQNLVFHYCYYQYLFQLIFYSDLLLLFVVLLYLLTQNINQIRDNQLENMQLGDNQLEQMMLQDSQWEQIQ